MDLGIAGRVALVTAASKGLGRASAEALAGEGVRVVISARGKDALAEAEAAVRDAGAEVLAIPADMSGPHTPATLVAATVERFGGLDIVVANNGGPPRGGALDVSDDQLREAFEANMLASVRLARESIPHMRSQRWGRICCITSVSVKQPMPQLALSNVARTGLWAWAKTAARDLFDDGITVNLACPGTHDTERVREVGAVHDRLGDPADFGKAVAFLCSEPAKFISGVALQVDGAATLGLL